VIGYEPRLVIPGLNTKFTVPFVTGSTDVKLGRFTVENVRISPSGSMAVTGRL
jgi:hypothetical protein